MSFRYTGAMPWIALKVKIKMLKLILSTTVSQWSCLSIGVICSDFHVQYKDTYSSDRGLSYSEIPTLQTRSSQKEWLQ